MYINIYNKADTSIPIQSYESSKYIVQAYNDSFSVLAVHENTSTPYSNIFVFKENCKTNTEPYNDAIDDNTSKGLIKKEPKTSKAQLEAVKRYQQGKAEIRLRVAPEIKQLADKQAKSKGLSLTAYISQLIEEDT